jgi:hypothetical protein
MSLVNLGLAVETTLTAYADADFPGGNMRLVDADGVPIDATSMVLTFAIRSFDDQSGSALLSINSDASSGNRIVWTDRPNGWFRLLIDKAALAALPRTTAPTNGKTVCRWSLLAAIGSDEVRIGFGNFDLLGIIQ